MVCVFFNDVTLHRVPAVQYSVYNTCTVHTQFTEPPASVTHCFLHFCSPTQFPLLKVMSSDHRRWKVKVHVYICTYMCLTCAGTFSRLCNCFGDNDLNFPL